MHHHYADILDRLGPPLWWDEHAVPRYCEFAPGESANIYSRNCLLLLIACQGCGVEFKVCMTDSTYDDVDALGEAVLADKIHYGDPPNSDCCGVGASMNSIPKRVIEFWSSRSWKWERRPEFERAIDCEWAREDASDPDFARV